VNASVSLDRLGAGAGSHGGWGDSDRGIFAFQPAINHPYTLQITPLSTNSASFAVYDGPNGPLLESLFYDNSPMSVPNTLHISIFAEGGSFVVNSVAIVPEPPAAALATSAVLGVAACRWRNRRAMSC
jgi:hypothetical protein